jgi:ribosomal protein S18 acetylase RimI-like enzyme
MVRRLPPAASRRAIRDHVGLRAERSDDAPFVYRLYASTRADEMALVPWDPEEKDAFLRMQFRFQTLHYRRAYPGAAFEIVLLDGRPVGRLYTDRGKEEIRVIDIALVPGYRGAGIGTELLRGLLSEAAALNKAVSVRVERQNRAVRLYTRLGFRVVADQGMYLVMEAGRLRGG